MKSLGLSRYALAMGAVSALLAGCRASQPPLQELQLQQTLGRDG